MGLCCPFMNVKCHNLKYPDSGPNSNTEKHRHMKRSSICSDLSPLHILTPHSKTGLSPSDDPRVAGTGLPPRQSVTADKKQISQP